MITKYDTYIKGKKYTNDRTFATEIALFISKIISYNSNLIIKNHGPNELYIYTEYNENHYKYHIEYNPNYYYSYDFDEYNEEVKSFPFKTKLKEFIKDYINNYYDSKYDIDTELKYIPVFDDEKYSDFILYLINKNPKFIEQYSDIEKYLTNDAKNELKHLIEAKNFDLI